MPHGEQLIELTIIPRADYFIIAAKQGVIGGIKKIGMDWILMPPEQMLEEEIYSIGHRVYPQEHRIVLGAAALNQIAGEIENHLK